MRGMRIKGEELDTNFGLLKESAVELPLARLQNTLTEKAATYFDKYDVRVTCELKAGNSDVNYSTLLNALQDANLQYREVRRYNIEPDRVMLDILILREDIPVIEQLNKDLVDYGVSFNINGNVPEDVSPRVITTDQNELDKTKEEKKELTVDASKKTATEIKTATDIPKEEGVKEWVIVNTEDSSGKKALVGLDTEEDVTAFIDGINNYSDINGATPEYYGRSDLSEVMSFYEDLKGSIPFSDIIVEPSPNKSLVDTVLQALYSEDGEDVHKSSSKKTADELKTTKQ